MINKKPKILFSGGGTGGTVTPLLAVAEDLRASNSYDLLFVGTHTGPERELIEKAGFRFLSISSGKLRRYFSWKNFSDIFKIKIGFFQSLILLKREKPSLVLSAGAFVSVPLALAAWIYRIPVIIHQQDIRAGLANKLMAPLARVVTVTFEKSLRDYGRKALWIGNPSKDISFLQHDEIILKLAKKYNLDFSLPILLVVGGGTGATAINNLLEKSLRSLCEFCQVIHVSGKGKGTAVSNKHYHQFELLSHSELQEFEVIANLVVSRCGLGFLTELSALSKPSILIPMPNSHQEDNATIFAAANAAKVLSESDLSVEKFTAEIKEIISNKDLQKTYAQNIIKVMKPGATATFVKIVLENLP